uniref:Uncharacterized protein n=1 Tax=Tanacetum cinerariifolium TaxID=118510 RepID=A0A6L2JEY2_TANCI|nr:hypothetical protein [Tanacetum cinerariifolium]
MAFKNFIYTKDDDDLAFLPKDPSSRFGTSSPSTSVNTELPKDAEEPKVQPVEITVDSGEILKAGVFIVHPGSIATRIKERKYKMKGGLPDCFELKDANACHLKISAITLPAWKSHLDNQMDLELLDLHDHCYARQPVVDNAVNKMAREFLQVIEKVCGEADVIKARERSHEEECEELQFKCEGAMAEFDQNPIVIALQEKIYSLTADVKEHKVSKVIPYAAMELVHSDEVGRLVGMLVSSVITYGCYRAYEQVAAINEPFDLSKAKGYHSLHKNEHTQANNDFSTATFHLLDEFIADAAAPIEALLSKKPPTLQKPTPSRTQMHVPSSQKSIPSSAPS